MLLAEVLRFLHIEVSPSTFDSLHFLVRKLAHLTEYAVLAFLLYRSLRGSRPRVWELRTAAWSVLVAGLYSLTDELHQRFVPGRGGSLVDCGIDTAGAILAMLGFCAASRMRQANVRISAAKKDSPAENAKGAAGE